jgi:hypothetical protein
MWVLKLLFILLDCYSVGLFYLTNEWALFGIIGLKFTTSLWLVGLFGSLH